jgi:hypothetical protein
MTLLNPEQIQQYLLRSYTAVDGLWFMRTEAQVGFQAALEIDRQVWAIMPKIQARHLKELLQMGNGLNGLARCLEAKLELDGFQFGLKESKEELTVEVHGCPWQDRIAKAGRAHLGSMIASVICPTEYTVWGEEFGCRFTPADEDRICSGKFFCQLRFRPPCE